MRILLVQPDFRLRGEGLQLPAMTEPLALEILAATVADHEVEILDLRVDADLEGALQRFAPEVLGVTALTTEVEAARQVLQTAKNHAEEIFTVAGGHHATLAPTDFHRPYVDAIGLGEGELVFPQLIEALADGRRLEAISNLVWSDPTGGFRDNGRTIPDLDADGLPQPRRDLVEAYRNEYFFLFDQPDSAMVTGRGCPYRCNFCSVWEFYGGKIRQMSPRRVLEEIDVINTEHVTFVDDNFLIDSRRAGEIAERIKAQGIELRYSMECRPDAIVRHPELIETWVDVGLYGVLLGLESSSDQMLEDLNKKNSARVNDEAISILKANGIIIWGAFMVHPDWEEDDFKQLRDYVADKGITHTQFTVLTPLPGTRLYRDRYHELLTHDYTYYDTLHAVLPTRLPREEFYRHFAELYSHASSEPALELVRQGKITIADLKRGYKMLQKLSQWEFYAETDPVLGRPVGP